MIQHKGNSYSLTDRVAEVGELIRTKVYISNDYPIGSIMKVHQVVEALGEVKVYPDWYEEGMVCFGITAFLEHEDYEVLVES